MQCLRWPPAAADIATHFSGLCGADLGWLGRHPRVLQRLQQLLRQLAKLRSIHRLVLGQVRCLQHADGGISSPVIITSS